MAKNITVFGATGNIGSTLLRLLSAAQIPATAVTRDINKAIPLPGINWVQADIADKQSLYTTMDDNKAIFLLSGHSTNFINEQGNVIEVAKEQDVRHIVKLSSGAADSNSPFHISRAHGEVEDLLRESGIPATILRPNGFMQNWLGELAATVKAERRIYEATGLGKRAYIDMRDIAAVAFEILKGPQPHTCHAYMLTGPEAVSYKKVAQIITDEIGEQVTYIQLTIEEARQRMENRGMPPHIANALLTYTQEQKEGKTTFVSPDVENILARKATSVKLFVKDYVERFK